MWRKSLQRRGLRPCSSGDRRLNAGCTSTSSPWGAKPSTLKRHLQNEGHANLVIAGRFSFNSSKARSTSPNLGLLGANLAEAGPEVDQPRPNLTNTYRVRRKLVLESIKFGKRPNVFWFRRRLPDIGQIRPQLTRHRPNFARIRFNLARMRFNLTRSQPDDRSNVVLRTRGVCLKTGAAESGFCAMLAHFVAACAWR